VRYDMALDQQYIRRRRLPTDVHRAPCDVNARSCGPGMVYHTARQGNPKLRPRVRAQQRADNTRPGEGAR